MTMCILKYHVILKHICFRRPLRQNTFALFDVKLQVLKDSSKKPLQLNSIIHFFSNEIFAMSF